MRWAVGVLVGCLLGCAEPPELRAAGARVASRSEPAPPGSRRAGPREAAQARAPVQDPPPATSVRFLKGQTHVHTSGSYDSKAPPGLVLRFYAAHGYDFVAITDHNRVTRADAPPGLIVVAGVELTQNSVDCTPLPPPGFRCLIHTSALFVDPAKDPHRGELFKPAYRQDRHAAYASQLELAVELGGVGVLNHPGWHASASPELTRALAQSGLRFVEIVNAALVSQSPLGQPAAERQAEEYWDAVLSRGALVYGVAADDAHHFDGDGVNRRGKAVYGGDRAFIMVRAEKRADAIRSAMLGGDFYMSTGVLLDELMTSASRLELGVVGAPSKTYRSRFIGRGGRLLKESSGTRASYLPRGDEGYVRAVVEEQPGGRKAWSQPVFIGRAAGSAS